MTVSHKCQYALRAVFELAKHFGQGPIPISQIAESQAIPPRFLELILSQLRQAGYVESRRGVAGGYILAAAPSALTVGQVIRHIEGPLVPVKCIAGQDADCPLLGNCAFMGLWKRAQQAMAGVYDGTSFQDLLDQERASRRSQVQNYCI